jgi:cytochrome c556
MDTEISPPLAELAMKRFGKSLSFVAIGVVALVVGRLGGDEPPKVSQFAPAEDLTGQVTYYVGRIDEALADPKDYDEAKQSRVGKDANTLAALALSLSLHDVEGKYRGGALLKAAQRLAESSGEYAPAAAAAAEVKTAAAGGDEKPSEIKWSKVASLSALMKQVPVVNNALKRGLDPARFQRQAAQSAGQAATLAAIAQAVMYDDEYATDPATTAQWQTLCQQMRDAAAEVNAAVHSGKADAAQAAMKRLAQNCDACHEKFREHE